MGEETGPQQHYQQKWANRKDRTREAGLSGWREKGFPGTDSTPSLLTRWVLLPLDDLPTRRRDISSNMSKQRGL